MSKPKHSLADLKRLRQDQQAAKTPPGPAAPAKRRKADAMWPPAQGPKPKVLLQGGGTSGPEAPPPLASGQPARSMPPRALLPADALLPEADRQLFRRVMQAVTPLKATTNHVPRNKRREDAGILQRRRHAAAGSDLVPQPALSDSYANHRLGPDGTYYLQASHGPDVLKRLQKGHWPIEAHIDLHGATLDAARQRLDQFIQLCTANHMRCVCVVHGQGYGSKNGQPVLKNTVRRWLSQMACVAAYTECGPAEGGAGAVKVLLKKA